MEFSADKPIYRQIIDYSFGRILTGAWEPGGRIPSIRELTIELTVNSHTILKAFEYLQAENIIYPKRGMGYYLADDALTRVNEARRREFFDNTVPELSNEMKLLGITVDELVSHLRKNNNETAEQ